MSPFLQGVLKGYLQGFLYGFICLLWFLAGMAYQKKQTLAKPPSNIVTNVFEVDLGAVAITNK